jgi:hypothetical protein
MYDEEGSLFSSIAANPGDTFSITAPAGTYTLVAVAHGYLSAEGSVTLTGGSTVTQPNVELVPGDVDNNDVIDQFDAMSIGMNYNSSTFPPADLNNDNIINVLDLEILARNYRQIGPIPWE